MCGGSTRCGSTRLGYAGEAYPGTGTYISNDEKEVLDFKKGRFQWSDTNATEVRITRNGIRIGCKLVTWEAWDEIKRLVGEM